MVVIRKLFFGEKLQIGKAISNECGRKEIELQTITILNVCHFVCLKVLTLVKMPIQIFVKSFVWFFAKIIV